MHQLLLPRTCDSCDLITLIVSHVFFIGVSLVTKNPELNADMEAVLNI
jgi:hypothetical protein